MYRTYAVADPDFELRGGGGADLDLLALSAIFPSVISSFFTQNKEGARVQKCTGLPRLCARFAIRGMLSWRSISLFILCLVNEKV